MVALARTESFSMAAEQVGISQPPLSRSIRLGERRVSSEGAENGRETRPSSAISALSRQATAICSIIERIVSASKTDAGERVRPLR